MFASGIYRFFTPVFRFCHSCTVRIVRLDYRLDDQDTKVASKNTAILEER
jgi:hypothetical protein